jgi:small-conductance mechanosensitive channel
LRACFRRGLALALLLAVSGTANAQAPGAGPHAADDARPAIAVGVPAQVAAPPAADAAVQPQVQQAQAQAAPPPAPRPPPPIVIPEDITQPVAKLTAEITALEAALDQAKERDEELIRLRAEVQEIAGKAHGIVDQLRPRLEGMRQQIAKLGSPPARDAPPEPEAMTHERTKLNALAGALDGAIRTADLLGERASQVVDRIQQHQRELFTRSVLRRTPSPVLPTLWLELGRESKRGLDDIRRLLENWWSLIEPQKGLFALLCAAALGLWLALRLAAGILVLRHRDARPGEASFFGRAAAAAWVAPTLALPPVLAMACFYAGLAHLDVLHLGLNRLATTALHAVIAFAAVTALADALLAPKRVDWRLFNVSDQAAARISWLMYLIAGVYALDLVLKELNNVIFAPLSVTIAQSFLAGVAFAWLLIVLLRTPFGAITQPIERGMPTETVEAPERALLAGPPSRLEPRWLKLPLWVAALGIIAAAVLGYVSLARFLSGQLVVTGSIIVALILLHHAVRALAADLVDAGKPAGRWLAVSAGLDEARRKQLALAFSVFVNGGLFLLAAPLVLLQWGFDWPVVKSWLMAALFGFKIGSIEVSLTRILLAVTILVAGLLATRMLQRSLDQTVLTGPRMDAGIANSIRTAVGYAGIGAAVLIAVSYAGLDFTNLAIVAGALSVGIGFGLQSVVNNFVSGLILLVERPVKVGDWIVVGSDEGYVRRISVRSTEIETFDRSSVIIPNAELIQGRVKNWTLRDATGRVRIPVGIGYGSDPERAREVLLAIANAHPGVLRTPPPSVGFEGFGASSVDLALRLFVSDVAQGGAIRTEIAFQILKAFREAGIELPFPQADVHLRDLDPLKELFLRSMEERSRIEPQKREPAPPPRMPTPLKTA